LTLLLLLQIAPARALVVTDGMIGDNASFFVLFPQLRALPAPPILTNGLRVTYSSASGGGGSGGGGFIQYDVVAQNGGNVLIYQHSYADDGGGLKPLSQAPAFGVPALGPMWIHPAVLVNAEAVASGSLSVTRYLKPVAGATREVVRFQTTTLNGSTIVTEFSASSGLMVFSSIGTVSAGAQLVLLAADTLPAGWPQDAAPRWARTGAVLQYAGSKTTTLSGGSPISQSLATSVTATEGNIAWTTFQGVEAVGGITSGGGASVTGIAQLTGSIWVPRAALSANLPTAPTVLHSDPVTGAQTYVYLNTGINRIVVQQEMAGAISRWEYDRNFGVLVRQSLQVNGVAASEVREYLLSGGSNLAALAAGPELPGGSGGGDQGDQSDPGDRDEDPLVTPAPTDWLPVLFQLLE
jgi:hypothetical protein